MIIRGAVKRDGKHFKTKRVFELFYQRRLQSTEAAVRAVEIHQPPALCDLRNLFFTDLVSVFL